MPFLDKIHRFNATLMFFDGFDGVLMLWRPLAAYWGRLAVLVVVAVLVGGLPYISR